jgi:hypothetical protein
MKKTEAYKQGFLTGIKDWKITGTPYNTRPAPYHGRESHYWFLGRLDGFREAESLLRQKKKETETLEE